MTNTPYPEGWRPTWARLAIFQEAESRRYRLYAVSESTLEDGGEERIPADRQPREGFRTLAEARFALAEADPAAELARLRCRRGKTRTPRDETEAESVRACGAPRRRESKADPGGVPSDMKTALRATSKAVTKLQRGTALRIAPGRDGIHTFLMIADHAWNGGLTVEPAEHTSKFINDALERLGMTESDLLGLVESATETNHGGTPPRTLWNEPPVVVSGMNEGLIEQLLKRRPGPMALRRRPPAAAAVPAVGGPSR